MSLSRRRFLRTAAAATAVPYVFSSAYARQPEKNSRLRLDRKLAWDPKSEAFVDDDEANAMVARKQRGGYEIQG